MKRVCIIGSGHVGLVAGACLAELGHHVICVDKDQTKIRCLQRGGVPFYEPGLEDLVARHRASGRLSFTSSIGQGASNSEVVFIAVGTPQGPNGEADISAIGKVSHEIAHALNGYKVIVEKSTVPVRTGAWIKETLNSRNQHQVEFDIVCNPEFLREGTAIYDFMNPDRIVIGAESEKAINIMKELYSGLKAPVIVSNIETAELIKHASNSFLALKLSYINAVANICSRVGADVTEVAAGMGLDHRIGPEFLKASLGYGGYCLPKDVAAFIRIAEAAGYDFSLLKAVQWVNEQQRQLIIDMASQALGGLAGRTLAVLGLAYKANTDDIRESPAVYIIQELLKSGAQVKAYDPHATGNARSMLPELHYCADAYQAVEGSDALIITTEWEEFRNLDLARLKRIMRCPVIVDGRNLFNTEAMHQQGFIYLSIGR